MIARTLACKICWTHVCLGLSSVFSYSGCLMSCYSSYAHSCYTVLPPPPLCMDIVPSTYHIHPLARCRCCHTRKADSPGSFDAPGCGNHDDKSHSVGLRHIPKTVKVKLRGITKGRKDEVSCWHCSNTWMKVHHQSDQIQANNLTKALLLNVFLIPVLFEKCTQSIIFQSQSSII